MVEWLFDRDRHRQRISATPRLQDRDQWWRAYGVLPEYGGDAGPHVIDRRLTPGWKWREHPVNRASSLADHPLGSDSKGYRLAKPGLEWRGQRAVLGFRFCS